MFNTLVKKGYCFDDLLLTPKFSKVISRQTVDTSVDLGKGIVLKVPFISANMKNVTEVEMAKEMWSHGGLGILHRFCSLEKQIIMLLEVQKEPVEGKVGCSVGVKEKDQECVDALVDAGCEVLCVDVAHGHHINCTKMVEYIAKKHPKILLIAGNVATGQGAKMLHESGADVIKTGIGGGSLCSTRIETGNGVPNMTALSEVFGVSLNSNDCTFNGPELTLRSSKIDRKFKIIADGGLRRSGDCVKALCFSDAVMLGSILSGTNEAPGVIEEINGIKCKAYEGSSTHKTSNIEGIKAHVPLKGPLDPIIKQLLDGIRSGCSYQGVNNLTDLKKDPIFVEISNAAMAVSRPHSVIMKD